MGACLNCFISQFELYVTEGSLAGTTQSGGTQGSQETGTA